MLVTEHEGKQLLQSFGIAVPNGFLVHSKEEVQSHKLGFPIAIKAQVAAGSRGKAGGVVRANDLAEAVVAVEKIFQTQFSGETPDAILIEPWLPIKREIYLSVVADGRADGYVVLYSPRGGIDIEQGQPPMRYNVGLPQNFRGYRLRALLADVEPDASLREKVIALSRRLLHVAKARDCVTVEINPLVQLENGALIAADAKVVYDESAAFRSLDIKKALDKSREEQPEATADALRKGLMMVWLDGDVGLISGGAGMTMAAMDAISEAGGQAACFLDCSGNPTPTGYRLAFDLLDAEPKVRVILVSIFGGGTHMDRVARVMTEIYTERKAQGKEKPVVFRLNGTNANKVDPIFDSFGLHNYPTLEAAVDRAVAISKASS